LNAKWYANLEYTEKNTLPMTKKHHQSFLEQTVLSSVYKMTV